MLIMITGAKGFIGKETTKYLEEKGVDVISFDLMDGCDIRDQDQIEEFIRTHKPDRVLHLAAIARFADADRNPLLAHETNVLGTENVVDACMATHTPLVYASTGSVYMPIQETPPITEDFAACGNSVYGCTKYLGELYVREHTPNIILRYAHLYGKEKRSHGLIGGYWDRIQRGLKPKLYGGSQSNDFCYITDIAQANYKAVTAPWDKWNQTYNIGSGEELTAKEAGEIVCKVTGWEGGVEKVKSREVDAKRFVYDITKARVMLNYEPLYTFEKGLKEMFK